MITFPTPSRLSLCVTLLLLPLLLVEPPSAGALDPRFTLEPGQLSHPPRHRARLPHRHQHRPRRHHHRSVARGESATNLRLNGSASRHPATTLQLTGTAPLAAGRFDTQIRQFWDAVSPHQGPPLKPLVFSSSRFSLTVDPSRYPLLQAADGGTVLLDADGTLPALVQTLIHDQDPAIRIVSGPPGDGRRLLASLLAAGGFYSVAENPVMTFGTDPQLTLRPDFKVERTPDSLLRNDLVLVSAARQGYPPALQDYIKNQGFRLLEPLADQPATAMPLRHRIVEITDGRQGPLVDRLLGALAIPAEHRRRIQLFSAAENGISLDVTADRYFERAGNRYVVARFTGDPVAYTLTRLLETKGYRVVFLEPHDTFRVVAAKLLTALNLPAVYASHLLLADAAGRYSLQMSGFLLENGAPDGGAVMVTDRPLDAGLRELLHDDGYQVQER